MDKFRVDGEKKFMFSYNSSLSAKSPIGMKRTWVTGKNKTEARKKIKQFLSETRGEFCFEYF